MTAVFRDWERRPGPLQAGPWDPGRPASHRTIVMRPAGVIRGAVRFAGGEPAPGATVTVMVFTERNRGAILPDLPVRTSADPQGRFVVGPLPLGQVEVVVMAGPRSEFPHRIRAVRRPVAVGGELDPPLDLVLDWVAEESLAPR